MGKYKKRPSKREMLEQLRLAKIHLPPVAFIWEDNVPQGIFSAYLKARWDANSTLFAALIEPLSTPKSFMQSVSVIKTSRLPGNYLPILIMPFLKESQLLELESENISGMDLCGNGIITIPGKLRVFRSGKPDKFLSWAPIKNIYAKNSSLVGRTLLLQPRFFTVKDMVEEIAGKDVLSRALQAPSLTFSTVSKALSTMEQDLIIERKKNLIRLIQSDTLLERLVQCYGIGQSDSVQLKVSKSRDELIAYISHLCAQSALPIAATGLSSVWRYAVMQRGEILSVYCPSLPEFLDKIEALQTDKFPNLSVIETRSPLAYFDSRSYEGLLWASPLQTYIELMRGDKRDRETATQLKAFIEKELEAYSL